MQLELMNNWSFGINWQICPNESACIDVRNFLFANHCNDLKIFIS
jgi:hypothetical protein